MITWTTKYKHKTLIITKRVIWRQDVALQISRRISDVILWLWLSGCIVVWLWDGCMVNRSVLVWMYIFVFPWLCMCICVCFVYLCVRVCYVPPYTCRHDMWTLYAEISTHTQTYMHMSTYLFVQHCLQSEKKIARFMNGRKRVHETLNQQEWLNEIPLNYKSVSCYHLAVLGISMTKPAPTKSDRTRSSSRHSAQDKRRYFADQSSFQRVIKACHLKGN